MRRRAQRKTDITAQCRRFSLGLLVISLGLFGASLLLSGSSLLKAAAPGFRQPIPYLLALAALTAALGQLLKKRGTPAAPKRREPEWFPAEEPAPVSTRLHRADASAHTARRPADAWTLSVFQDIEWKRFETLCGQLFAQAGFEARTQSHGADGGVDIWLHSSNALGPVAIVQCKHWQGKPVGVKEVRELLGVMTAHKLARGTFVTSSSFTDDALRFARENRIHTLDGPGLLRLIGKRSPEQQQALLAHAYEGEYWRPTCPSCGIKLVERSARKQGSGFWGCSNYPRCRFTLPMRSGKMAA